MKVSKKVSQKVSFSTPMTLVCNAKIEISSLTGHCTVVLHRYVAAHTVWKITHMSYFLTPMLDMPKKCQRLVKNEKLMEIRVCEQHYPRPHLLEWNLSFYYNNGQLLKKIIEWFEFSTVLCLLRNLLEQSLPLMKLGSLW